jgi:hypothetical protein
MRLGLSKHCWETTKKSEVFSTTIKSYLVGY